MNNEKSTIFADIYLKKSVLKIIFRILVSFLHGFVMCLLFASSIMIAIIVPLELASNSSDENKVFIIAMIFTIMLLAPLIVLLGNKLGKYKYLYFMNKVVISNRSLYVYTILTIKLLNNRAINQFSTDEFIYLKNITFVQECCTGWIVSGNGVKITARKVLKPILYNCIDHKHDENIKIFNNYELEKIDFFIGKDYKNHEKDRILQLFDLKVC